MNKTGVDDMVMLQKISESAIVENIKKRYDADIIYTYIGHVLIAMNPYKNIEQLYLERTLKDYRGKYQYELPPHVYAVADNMYRSMFSEGVNQCVIISGESGAGKTVTSKHIMQFIAAVSGSNPEVQRTKDIILESNPVLEAFGNAKTIRNNNSSRFGKYMEIQFDLKGDPEGGRITNYLLEKSRVVFQQNGERNFHIFYQVFTDNKIKGDLGLGNPADYNYIRQGNAFQVEGVNDTEEFRDTLRAMDVVGVTADEKASILQIIGAILNIGNITFVDGGSDNSDIKDQRLVDTIAQLLKVAPQSVKQALLFRTINTGGAGKRGSTYACPNNVEGALYSRDALAKALYSKLFDWIVAKINEGLYINDPDSFSIGVLDIYGFEIFHKNGFEQLCINYVNEKLQQIFIQLTLKAEQEEYGFEGIPWENIDYFNNKICCDLIESKLNPIGVLSLLDDVCNFPKGSDDKFLQKLGETYNQHAHFTMAGAANEFTIKHYAGDVSYNVDGFCDKNKDLLFNDLIELCASSNNKFIRDLFPEVGTMDKKRPTTSGFKIKTSIQELVDTLSKCQPHYIRCIKPNEKKLRNNFDNSLVTHQVRYLGLLENVRVRRAGFAYRQFYDKFFYRYRVCSEQTWPRFDGDMKSGTAAILRVLNLGDKEFANGKTKIFVRNPETVFSLEEMRERKVQTYANRIQRFFGRFALRRYYWELETAGNNAIYGKKERRRLSFERPYTGDYINYRENYELKKIVEDYGKEKVHFADNVTKYDRRSRRQRRILLMSDKAVYIIALDKNKDKDKIARAKKPFIYYLKRRVELTQVKSIVLSPFQDNFMLLCFGPPSDHDNIVECRRKTEFISCMKKIAGTSIEVSDTMNSLIKGGKRRAVKFVSDPKGAEGKMKGAKVGVAPGMSKDSKPNLPEPKQVETHNILPQRSLQRKEEGEPPAMGRPMPGARGSVRGSPSPAPPRPASRAAPSPRGRGGPPIPAASPPIPGGSPSVRGRGGRGGRPY